MNKKEMICASLERMADENRAEMAHLTDSTLLTDYQHLAQDGIWTNALQAALWEHQCVIIPPADAPYWIDDTVVIPSDRHIEAEGAVIQLTEGCNVLMLRNEHTQDGTHQPICTANRDRNISIHGGTWAESRVKRQGYGQSGRYAHKREEMGGPFYGVSTCMLFNNLTGLTLSHMTFRHTAGFSVQTGDLTNGLFENITFEECFADGLHCNGNSENLLMRNIAGQVGDDLVALNMYDWQNSSVNFGPTRNILCDGLHLSADSRYKALRIEPGLYTYDDGSTVDCGLFDAVIRNVRGISTFKMYFQTPRYIIGSEPERGGVGSADNLFFENISVDLTGPIDRFDEYMHSDPVRGTFAAFELGANIGHVSFKDIDLTLYPEQFPMSCLVCIGPKSVRMGDFEIFDPYLSSCVGTIELENIRVNGEPVQEAPNLIRTIRFEDINHDGHSTASGTVDAIRWVNGKILCKKC